MSLNRFNNVKVSGIACAVPNNIVDTKSYYDILGKEVVDKFISTVGVKSRFMGEERGITTSDLCFASAEKLIKELDIDRKSIDVLILVTQSADYLIPATSCVLQYRLGLSEQCMAYDVNLGCSGYVYGLNMAASHLQNKTNKKVLLLVGDSSPTDEKSTDRSQAMLFGDAGTATLLEYTEEESSIDCYLKTQGEGFRYLIKPCGGCRNLKGNKEKTLREDGTIRSDYDAYMDGAEIFNFSIKQVPKLFKEFYEQVDLSNDNFNLFAFHQANDFMLKHIRRKLKIDKTKMPISIDIYGNTSSASIPITICDSVERNNIEDKEEYNVISCGFGIGLSLGIASFKVRKDRCFNVIKTLDSFEDGILK